MTRYVANDTNLVREGALTGTNALASDAIYRTDTAAKIGGGQAVVTGPYSGAATTDIDVEIVDNAGSTPQVSAPAFSGVGNGTLTGLAVAGIASQVITITLEDLGTETRKAYAPFQGVTLRAKTAPGNGITISIDQSGLVLSDTDFALQEDLSPGTNEYEGTHWDISALGEMTLTPDGKIPGTAPRVVFGADPQVYSAFRQYKNGRYVYGFSPAPVRVAVRGTRIHKVTGSRTLTVRDGATTEVFTGCGSLYQTLLAIRDGSALVEVEGPVVNDRLPGGQATVDLSVWTSSYVIGIAPDGSYSCLKADLLVTPSATAPTEQLTIQCINAEATGQEIWRVDSDVSGRLANATTFQPYADGPYEFTIPAPEIPQSTPGNSVGKISFSYEPVPREQGSLPNIKLFRPQIGAAAKNGTYEFTYVERPESPCDEEGAVSGRPNADCLGITPIEDTNVSDFSHLIRAQRLSAAVRELIATNTAPPSSVAAIDVDWINTSARLLQDCAAALPAATYLELPVWQADHVYEEDDMAEPVVRNGWRYAVQVAGTSGSTAPTWPTTEDATVTDGGVTWVNLGKTPWQAFDDMFTQWKTEAELISFFATPPDLAIYPAWTSGILNGVPINVFKKVVPTTRNGCVYSGAGQLPYTSGGEPTWAVGLGTTSTEQMDYGSGNEPYDWTCTEQYWIASHYYPEGTIVMPGNGSAYRCSTPGISDTTEPTWAATVTDGAAVWAEIAGGLDITQTVVSQFFDRYRSMCNDVLAIAGKLRDFDLASNNGDGCWQDPDHAKYWQSTDDYLPVFNNVYWHSSREFIDEDGNPYNESTREFGFGLQVGCVDNLVTGDKFYVTISGVVGSSTGQGYQEGDTFNVRVQNAVPVPFGGGQTGDDTQTWSVVLSAAGRLPDYALITTALAAYSGTVAAWVASTAYAAGVQRRPTVRNGFRYTSSGGTSDTTQPTWPTTIGGTVVDNDITWTCSSLDADIGFAITPGGIPFALGDKFVAEIEGGRFKWRRDGGSWSSNLDIATTALADGLSVQFNAGIAPSWAAGDRWTYRAEATYGAVQLRTPLDGEMEWTGSTVISLPGGAINGIGLYRHRIPSDATILFEGSDDAFATSPLSIVIPWRRDNLWQGSVANHVAYRLSINKGGAIRWLYLGPGTQLQIRTGSAELGRMVKRKRLTTAIAPSGLGATVTHEALPKAITDTFEATLSHATEFDDGLLGIVPNDTESETGLVRYESDTLEIDEVQGFQPTDSTKHLQSISLTLSAA